MAQKFDIGLNSKINEFCSKFGILRSANIKQDSEQNKNIDVSNDDEIFEDFGNYVIASNYLEEEIDNIKSISTNKAQGIDGVIIIINNRLISEISDLEKINQNEQIKIKLGFIQSTIQKSFDEQKFTSFTDEVVKFLTNQIDIEPFSTIYKRLLDEDDIFINRINETPRISLFFNSARSNHQVIDEKINIEKSKIISRNELENKIVIDKFIVLQKNELIEEYNKISKYHTILLKFENNIQLSSRENIELSLLSTIKFSELKKLILNSDNKLREKLFVENVRNYIGNTPVNIDIQKTLDTEKEKKYFPFLNNGLAIICDKIERHPVKPNEYTLTFPRIINGCQTTNELFKKYERSNNIDEVEIVAKVISTNDNNLKKLIIHAANNQNSIDKDLQSMNDFHETIEVYFLGKDEPNFKLFFERLRGQHTNVNPPYSKINIEYLARIYISVFKNKPHEMKSNAPSLIEKLQKEGKIFNKELEKPEQYYFCGALWYWFNHFFVNRKIILNSKSMDMHILMSCNLILETDNKLRNIEDKINYLNSEDNAIELFDKTTQILNSKDYLFERRGFYSNKKTQRLINEFI